MSTPATGVVVVAVAGHVCIDRNVIDGVRSPQVWGSAVLHADAYLARQHAVRREMIAPHGLDFAAHWPAIRFLNDPVGESTLTYENTVAGEQTTRRCWNEGSAAPLTLAAEQRSVIGRADVLIHAPLLPTYTPDLVDDLVSAGPARATRVLLGQGYLREVTATGHVRRRQSPYLDSVVDHFGTLVVSDDDIADDWTESRSIAADWARTHRALDVVVTRNARGAVLFRDCTEEVFPTKPVQAGHASAFIGAGDTFGAALALARARTGDIRSSIVIANAAARDFVTGKSSKLGQKEVAVPCGGLEEHVLST